MFYDKAMKISEQAQKTGDKQSQLEAEMNLAGIEEALVYNDKASQYGGTAWGRTGQFRQRMIAEDYSLAAMTMKLRKAQSWKEVSAKQRQQIIDLYKTIEKTHKDFEDYRKESEKRELAAAFNRLKADKAVRKAVEQKGKSIEEVRLAAQARFNKLAEQFKANVAGLHMNIDPANVKVLTMMAKEKIVGGSKDINKIVDDIHNTLEKDFPDLTKRDIRDAITKYGKEPTHTQGDLQRAFNEVTKQGRLLSAYEDALAGKEPYKRKTQKTPKSDEVAELEKKVKEAMRNAGLTPDPATPEEVYLKRAKTYYENRAKEIKQKIDDKDFAPRLKKSYPIDEVLMQKKAAYEGAKKEFNKLVMAEKLRNRPTHEKTLDKLVKTRRAILFTSSNIFEKLTAAGAARFVFEPVKSLIGGTFSYVPGIHYFAERAPIEGGGLISNAKGEIKRLSQIIAKQSYRDMWDMLITGENTLSKLDPKSDIFPKGDILDKILGVPGQSHETFKTVPKRGGYYYAYEKYVQHCLRNNNDPLEPLTKELIHIGALDYAKRQIFRNQNVTTKLWHEALGGIERKMPRTGKYITAGVQAEVPVVGVPTNIAIELYEMATGWMTAPAQMAYYRTFGKKAAENLKPEQYDNIYRAFKNGMLGIAIALLGSYLYEHKKDEEMPVKLGGFYVQGEKRKPTDVKADEARVGDIDIPKALLHNTYLMFLQGGYTAAKTADEYRKSMKGSELEALWSGAGATAKGIAQTVPFFEAPYQMGSAIVNPKRGEKFVGEQVKSLLPPDIPRYARTHDVDEKGNPIPRSPEGVVENILMGIPGLRQQVPENTKKEKTDPKAKLIDDLRNDEPDAKENLDEAKSEGQITKTEKKDHLS